MDILKTFTLVVVKEAPQIEITIFHEMNLVFKFHFFLDFGEEIFGRGPIYTIMLMSLTLILSHFYWLLQPPK